MTTVKLPNKYLIIAAFLAISALLLIGGYIGRRIGDRALKRTESALNAKLNLYSVIIDEHKAYIAQIEQQNKTLREAKKAGDVTNAELKALRLKDLNELTKAQVTIAVLRDSVKHNGRIITIHDTIAKSDENCILLPFSFSDTSKYINLLGRFSEKGILSYRLTIPATFSVYSGLDKDTKKLKTVVATDNPFIQVTGLSSVKMDMTPPKKIGIGLQIGYGITTQFKPSPYIGVGISYNFLRF